MEDIKSDEILLSICVPSYNRLPLLKRLGSQLLALSSRQIELVFCDDASTEEGVSAYLTNLKQQYERVQVFFNEVNLGLTLNYYRALELAKGTYAMLMSNEDLLEDDFEDRILPLLRTHQFDIIYSVLSFQKASNHQYFARNPTASITDFNELRNRYPHFMFRGHISGNLYKKSVLDFKLLRKIHNNDPHLFPIIPLSLMGLKNQKFLLLDSVLVRAEIHPPLYLSKANPKDEQQLGLTRQLQLFKYFIQLIIPQKEREYYYKILADYFGYNIFYKKKNGFKRLTHILTLVNDQELGKYFQRGLKPSLFFKYFKALGRKYLGLLRDNTLRK
jgi:glycosyltransferase involved in cell wall biosynthesis